MNVGEYSVKNRVVSWLLVIIMVGGGLMAFERMGKLEDPAFTIKSAKILTRYPGASAREVQDELTYHLEDAIQKMPQLKRIKMSVSRPGLSDIVVEFKDEYKSADLPDIFDELRRKISDVTPLLPPGAQAPMVFDDFGDVFGIYLMLTGEGYSWRDLHDTADAIKKQLVLVDGVRKVSIEGEQREVVYLDLPRSTVAEMGLELSQLQSVLGSQNVVVDAGSVQVGDDYVRFSPTGDFQSVQEIGEVLISSSDRRLVRLKDFATITRAYEEVPGKIYYLNGQPALSIGISMAAGQNVVEVGARVNEMLESLLPIIPIGMTLETVYNQPQEVKSSVSGFIVSVGEAVAIVLVVLLAFMGIRTGIVIGAVLLITVAGTLLLMYLFGIELQRISLGALVIALGMLVDNAIVVAEGMQVRMQTGMKAVQAAGEAVGRTIWALLGGTVIGILAFSAIGLSPDNTGEFASSLFYVILISLSLSWITAISTTPLLCALLLKTGSADAAGDRDPYAGRLFQAYRSAVAAAINQRWITLAVVVAVFALALIGFGSIKSGFFPDSRTPLFFVDVWEPEGTDIRKTREDALRVSEFIRSQPGVVQTAVVIGGPHQRFTLVYDAKEPSPVYAQVIVRTRNREQIPAMVAATRSFMQQEMPWTDPMLKPLRIGPGRDARIEARFSGPDEKVLRRLADTAEAIMRADPYSTDVRNDWRSPVKVATPIFDEQLARQLGVDRQELGSALKFAFDGIDVGRYRDGNRQLPIRLRAPAEERGNIDEVRDTQVWSPVLRRTVPVSQVVSGYETRWENSVIRGRDRMQTIIASCESGGWDGRPAAGAPATADRGDRVAARLPVGMGRRIRGCKERPAGPRGLVAPGFPVDDPHQYFPVRQAAPAGHHLADRAAGHRRHNRGPACFRRCLRLHVPAGRAVADRPVDQERHRPHRGNRPADRQRQGFLRGPAGLLRQPGSPGGAGGGHDHSRAHSAADGRVL